MKVDYVEFIGSQESQEIRGYASVDYGDTWVTWKWDRADDQPVLRLAAQTIFSITTETEEQ